MKLKNLHSVTYFALMLSLLTPSVSLSSEYTGGVWIPSKQSIISEQMAYTLKAYLMRIPSNDQRVNAAQMNQYLRHHKLPTIDLHSRAFRVELAYSPNYSGSSVVGAEFDDGTHKFCLPCETGHNSFEWGIFPYMIAPQ